MDSVAERSDHYAASGTKDAAVRDIISVHAYKSALKTGLYFSMASGAAVFAANKYWPKFRNRLSVSGKTALIMSSFLGPFAVTLEQRIVVGARDPERYLAAMDPDYVREKLASEHHLLPHHRLANIIYDYPYKTIALLGIPIVGGIYLNQRSNKAIKVSQQVMQARVYGQGALLCVLLGSMAFQDYMSRRGRFE